MMVLLVIGGVDATGMTRADMNLLRESDKLDNSKWLVQYVEQ
jgi:hypothetical protein